MGQLKREQRRKRRRGGRPANPDAKVASVPTFVKPHRETVTEMFDRYRTALIKQRERAGLPNVVVIYHDRPATAEVEATAQDIIELGTAPVMSREELRAALFRHAWAVNGSGGRAEFPPLFG